MEKFVRQYNEAVFDTDRALAIQVVHDALAEGVTPEQVVFGIVVPALEGMIPRLRGAQGVSLAQHFMASQIAAEVTDEMMSRFSSPPNIVGRMVIGTSSGDFHGLGKRIVSGCLKAQMIDVVDLGLNVDPVHFVEEVLARNASIIGISSMMMHTATGDNGCRKVRRILQERGLEKRIRIIVGGAPYRYDNQLYRTVGADAWAETALEAGAVVKHLLREVHS
ncbi:MAG: cobalamin-dependent protein [Desulfuromonadaceae bacterium]|nr:cobalamin-dependent protein [Desulfuromonadaceae bacterium]MDD5105555.1 cobalamin-dependent protein [Desulfuromonadaceae bacterium]